METATRWRSDEDNIYNLFVDCPSDIVLAVEDATRRWQIPTGRLHGLINRGSWTV